MLSNETLNKIFSKEEKSEYLTVHKKVMGMDSFVELDYDNPDHVRLNELTKKICDFYGESKDKIRTITVT